MQMKAYVCGLLCGLATAAVAGSWDINTTMRTRVEVYDFFDPGAVAVGRDNDYTLVGNLLRVAATRKSKTHDEIFEISSPALLFLPTDAVAAGAKGQLGLGGSYKAANGGQDASIFIKQAAITFKELDRAHLALKLGRYEFVEGQEVLTGDAVLDWLKKERIAHRVIGNFGFTHVQRSFDGLVATRDAGKHQLTLMAGLPTVGVFNLDGMQTLEDVHVVYGALNFRLPKDQHADGRLFLVDYNDARDALKVDNRALAARRLDDQTIHIVTLGAHALKRIGDWDLLGWGVAQGGDWGTQAHGAWAYAFEAGHQWPKSRWKPWVRAGLNRSSGDDNTTDGQHRTYFEVLPTPRIYARFPFFNPMNLSDTFISAILKPSKKLTVRTEWHNLDLTETTDLWYAGGGAFDRRVFGFAGRPAGGFSELADLVDVNFDYKLDDRTTLTLYHAEAFGGNVIRSTFPAGADAAFGYFEATHRF